MAWTATNPVSIGGDTKKSDWDALWDNCDFCYVPPATVEFFGQSSAPTGWTKKTDWTDNSMLVYTTGSIGSGGSDDPTSTWTTAISIQGHSLTINEIPSHNHSYTRYDILNTIGIGAGTDWVNVQSTNTGDAGSGNSHTHTIASQCDFEPYYQKMIAATKDADSWTAANPVSAVGNATKQNAHWAVLWANIDYCYLEATTIQFFGQSSAPTGWTKKTDWTDNSMLIYTTGSISNGGSDNAHSWTTAITINATTLTLAQLPIHNHTYSRYTSLIATAGIGLNGWTTSSAQTTGSTGGGGSHTHTISQDTFEPIYQKVIAATKDSGNWTDTDPVALYDPTKKGDYDIAWDNIVFNYLAAGTIKPFGQSSAPTGWTKKTDWTNNSMLVYTTGSISSGGSDDPTSTWTTAISVDNHTLTIAEMPAHTHSYTRYSSLTSFAVGTPNNHFINTTSANTGNTGGDSGHNHGVTQDSFAFLYQTVITATKDA